MQKYIINTKEQAKEFWEWIDSENLEILIIGNVIQVPSTNEEFEFPFELLVEFLEEGKIEEELALNPVIEQEEKTLIQQKDIEDFQKEQNPYSNDLIYGKDKTEQVVAIEVVDNEVWMFLNNGEIKRIPNKFWITTPNPSKRSTRLEGNLHYKHIQEFQENDDYQKHKAILYKTRSDFFTISDPQESAMVYNGITCFKGLQVDQVSVLSFDLETNCLIGNETLEPTEGENAKILLISNTFRNNAGKITRKLFCEDEYENQAEMILDWVKWVQEIDPTIIIGHNILGFDFSFLKYIAKLNNIDLELGRDLSPIKFDRNPSDFRFDGSNDYSYYNAHIFGRQIIDTQFLAYTYDFSRKYPNYKLKDIIDFEGLTKKDRQFYDAGEIAEKWDDLGERKKIKKYAEDDADDALALYDLMIPQYFYYAQYIPKPFQKINNSATGSQINAFLVRSYLQIGHSLPKTSEKKDYPGAISFGIPGVYSHTNKVDVASLYPSIIITNQIYDKEKDPNGHFLQMIEHFTAERLENKRKAKETGERIYKDLSNGQKIVVNSGYGLFGATGLLFNYPDGAETITRIGREIVEKGIIWASGYNCKQFPVLLKSGKEKVDKKSGKPELRWGLNEKVAEGKGFQIVNADTDSFSYTTGKKLSDEEFEQHIEEINNLYDAGIRWEDDGRYKTVFVVKTKNYVLVPYKKKDKITIKGSALKASMKENALKDFLHEVIDLFITNKQSHLFHLYNHYAQEIVSPNLDITRWSSKMSISKAVLNPTRTNEENKLNAVKHKNPKEGERYRVYFSTNENKPVKLTEDYANDHDVVKLLGKLYDTLEIFETVIDMKSYPNYKNVGERKLLGVQ